MTTALLVIDVQNRIMATAWENTAVIARIATMIERSRTSGVPVIFLQHQDAGLVAGSDDWQIVADLAPRDGEPVVAKSYPDSFAETTLRTTLDELGITRLVIAGAQSDACVRATTIRSLVEGYNVVLAEDAHTTDDTEFDLTDGEVVPLSAKSIVAHTNLCTMSWRYPGVSASIVPHDQIDFLG